MPLPKPGTCQLILDINTEHERFCERPATHTIHLEHVGPIRICNIHAAPLSADEKLSGTIQFDGKSSSRDQTASERETSPANALPLDPCLNNPVTPG